MNEHVKQSIDARKNAFSLSYEVSSEMQEKINKLFAEIEDFGKGCKDVGEFEAEFAKSPLNQKYLDLFTEIAMSSQAKVGDSGLNDVAVSDGGSGGLSGSVDGLSGSADGLSGSADGDSGPGAKVGEIVAEGVVSGAMDRAASQIKDEILPSRAAIHQEARDAVRGIPVVGDIVDIGEKASHVAHLGKIFGKKKRQ